MPSAFSVSRRTRFPSTCHRRRAAASRRKSRTGRMILHQLRAVLVARAGEAACDRPVAEPQARIGDGHDRGGDAAPVHVLDRLRRRPTGVGGMQQRPALDLCDPGRRREMMVDVDAVRLGGRRLLGEAANRSPAWSAIPSDARAVVRKRRRSSVVPHQCHTWMQGL